MSLGHFNLKSRSYKSSNMISLACTFLFHTQNSDNNFMNIYGQHFELQLSNNIETKEKQNQPFSFLKVFPYKWPTL